jgi:branched-chain amino acid transport system substrate-binding protein
MDFLKYTSDSAESTEKAFGTKEEVGCNMPAL